MSMETDDQVRRGTKRPIDEGGEEVEMMMGDTKRPYNLGAGMSAALKNDEALLKAVNEVQQAMNRMTELARQQAPALKHRNRVGFETELNASLVEALSTSHTSAIKIVSIFKGFQAELCVPIISKLPNEMLLEIFYSLPWEDIRACLSTCLRWKTILTHSPKLWRRPILVKGYVEDIDRNLRRLEVLSGCKISVLTLVVVAGVSDERYRIFGSGSLCTSMLFSSFPSHTLRVIDCYCRSKSTVKKLWNCVTSCTNLKILRWNYRLLLWDKAVFQLSIEGTPLAICKLDEFTFISSNKACEADDFLTEIISQVKVLQIEANFTRNRYLTLLAAASRTAEDLVINGQANWDPNGTVPEDGSVIKMTNLKRYTVKESGRGYPLRWPMVAEQLTALQFVGAPLYDTLLVNSCRGNLRSLYLRLGLKNVSLRRQFEEELFNMPRLENLILDFNRGVLSRSPSRDIITAFWNAIDTEDTGRPQVELNQILPKLKILKIASDWLMDMKRLIKFVDLRSRLGLDAINKISVCMNKDIPFEAEDRAWLENVVPTFLYNEEQDWLEDEMQL